MIALEPLIYLISSLTNSLSALNLLCKSGYKKYIIMRIAKQLFFPCVACAKGFRPSYADRVTNPTSGFQFHLTEALPVSWRAIRVFKVFAFANEVGKF